MAAAEARAAWQRTANRFFVQEDAKRAPKLACPSPPYPLSRCTETGPANTPDELENHNLGFMPRNRNSSYSDLPPEAKWWLQIQPDYINQKGLAHEQVESCENIVMKTVKSEDDDPLFCVEKHSEIEMGESYELLEMGSIGSSASKKFDDVFGRSEPWWRVVDGDELVSLVSQRSLEFIENCDLPRPQSRSIKRDAHGILGNYDNIAKSQNNDDVFSPAVDIGGNLDLASVCRTASCEEQALFGSDKQSSEETIDTSVTKASEIDPTKVQLMEALRHSQTRAREAEKAAKQANAEKEHILKLFLKQASHLFAYKQWFQLLQLENIYFNIKNSNHPLTSLFPVDLPFTSVKNSKLPKTRQKPAKEKKGSKKARGPKRDFGKFTIAFALGIGLVGAGLFLGWTVAWMLPAL